ncbi:MAG: PQQ-binding-like beta-propeller repeat protein, partial [Actinobacteria bacterium]|nr:PQQ-binding-like beta-propeller repeat protein [Actinomycetota bacterium]
MPTRFARRAAPIIMAAAVAAACSSGSTKSTTSAAPSSTAPSAAAAVTQDCTKPDAASNWLVYMRDDANSATNPCNTAITAKNVSTLAVDWHIDDLIGVTGVPTVDKGVVYFGDDKGAVRAVAAKTGKVAWTSEVGGQIVGSPAVTADSVYVGVGGSLIALDKATGKQQWKISTNPDPTSQINASPIVVDDMVIMGTASFQVTQRLEHYTFQGSIGAYDTKTGKTIWNHITTPNDATSGAGVAVWSTPAVDRKDGLLFIGTGQNLGPPASPNADSMEALDLATGKTVWSMQATENDIFSGGYPTGFDYDFGASPNLFTVDGRLLVGQGDKQGTYWVLDAKTGKVVWKRVLSTPSHFGGVIGSAGFHDGLIITSSNVGKAGGSPMALPETSKVTALSPKTGAVVWSKTLEGSVFGPISGVPGIAFVGTAKNHLYALDTRTGRTLWSYDAPAPIGGGASIVG